MRKCAGDHAKPRASGLQLDALSNCARPVLEFVPIGQTLADFGQTACHRSSGSSSALGIGSVRAFPFFGSDSNDRATVRRFPFRSTSSHPPKPEHLTTPQAQPHRQQDADE